MRVEIQQHINDWLGSNDSIADIRSLSGGDSSRVWWVSTLTNREMVVKTQSVDTPDVFETEKEGLQAIRSTHTVETPQVYAQSNRPSYIVLQAIPTQSPEPVFWEIAGRSLARLHRTEMGHRYGWHTHNFIGPTPQRNGWTTTWSNFWSEYRLGPQREWAKASGMLDPELERLLDTLMGRISDWISEERPCLLHGDLWSGNLLCTQAGVPVLIDPAVYLGHREADLAMTTLFGGFPASFYEAYQEVWPLEPGWEKRLQFYGLYHWLNHLNAFGSGYRAPCIQVLRSLLR